MFVSVGYDLGELIADGTTVTDEENGGIKKKKLSCYPPTPL